MPGREFHRKPPPLAARIAAGLWMECIFGPFMWIMRKLGREEKLLASFSDLREKEFAKNNPLRDYVPGKQDVFVMTYPRSGTNWMLQIVYQLIHHGKGEFDHIHSVVAWPDARLHNPLMARYAIPLEQATPEPRRLIKTHLNWELLPYSAEARYIAVIRDPKEVFVSAYYFTSTAKSQLETMYRLFLADKFPLGGSWPASTAGYWAQRHRANVLVISYASLKRDLQGTVRRVAAFLDIQVSDEVIREVCEKSSFDSMKRLEHKFGTGRMIPWRAPEKMIRQGGSGELLTPERQREIDAHCIAELKRLAPDLPYDELCQ